MVLVVLLGLRSSGQAAEFTCAAGNVACLITAIRAANDLDGPSAIRLTEGTYALRVAENETDGPNGLPSVTRTLTIQGSGARDTIVERAPGAPDFRLIHVARSGALTLEGLTLRGGTIDNGRVITLGGGGIFNAGGRVTLSHTNLVDHRVLGGASSGGGLFNNGGAVILSASTLARNTIESAPEASGGGLGTHGGSVTIASSTIADNRIQGRNVRGGGLAEISLGNAPAVVEIVNSTIARNAGGGLFTAGGHWTIINTTIAGNEKVTSLGETVTVGGISAGTGVVTLRNAIVAQNAGRDCAGPVTSLGHNLIGNPTGCPLALQPHDRTGPPGLAIYADDGTPGRGHWPLLPTSPAIDGGDATTCPPTDQLGLPRLGVCDIGAVELAAARDPLDDFVRGFYRHALGREPSPAEVAAWLSFLQAEPSLAGARVMTLAFFDGPEYRARPVTPESHVTALYRAILGRDPDAAELTGLADVLSARLDAVQKGFLHSPEFQDLVPDCHDEPVIRALVTRLYEAGLGRSPGIGEVNLWLFSFSTRCEIERSALTILRSEEYRRVPRTLAGQVVVLYRALLAREPAAEEVAGWVDNLAAPFVEDQLIDGPEFAARWRQLVS